MIHTYVYEASCAQLLSKVTVSPRAKGRPKERREDIKGRIPMYTIPTYYPDGWMDGWVDGVRVWARFES